MNARIPSVWSQLSSLAMSRPSCAAPTVAGSFCPARWMRASDQGASAPHAYNLGAYVQNNQHGLRSTCNVSSPLLRRMIKQLASAGRSARMTRRTRSRGSREGNCMLSPMDATDGSPYPSVWLNAPGNSQLHTQSTAHSVSCRTVLGRSRSEAWQLAALQSLQSDNGGASQAHNRLRASARRCALSCSQDTLAPLPPCPAARTRSRPGRSNLAASGAGVRG